MFVRFFSAFALWMMLSVPAAASGVVLILANENYDHLRDAREVGILTRVNRSYEAAGFDTDQATDLSSAAMRAALETLNERIDRTQPERVVIVFAGYVLHGEQGTWLMGTDTRNPSLINVDATGIRLQTLLAIAGRIQGGAVVAIADLGFPQRPGTGLTPGLPAALNVPQGVSLIRGPVRQVGLTLESLATPGTNLRAAATEARNVAIEGFDPPYLTFLPEGYRPAASADRRDWAAAESAATVEAYRAYLAAWPRGMFVDQARAAIAELENSPERIEASLNLTRDERRAIQRDLTILNFDPRGIDGVFGRGTRAAITAWQGRNGFPQHGYLDRDQIFRMASQAARRAAELEEEARRRAVEMERQDRAYWRDTGSGRDESGLRAYLDRFPDGIFSGIARQRLDEIEDARRQAAEARDRAAWDQALREDSVPAYERYLGEFPRGVFADQARARIEELTQSRRNRREIEAARAAEEAMQLPLFTRAIIEQRLAGQGFDPGIPDGNFDADTRRAIRRYQRASDLPVTGYLTEGIVSRLMLEGVLRLFQ